MEHKTLLRFIGTLLCLALVSGCAAVNRSTVDQKPADFAFFKSLEGRWESTVNEQGQRDVVVYKTTSAGQAVEETIFPGTPHEMVSVYYPSGESVAMTHYCMIGNRPQFLAQQLGDGSIVFDFIPTPGIDPSKDHLMNKVKMKQLEGGSLKITWSGIKEGKPDHTKVVELKRWDDCPSCFDSHPGHVNPLTLFSSPPRVAEPRAWATRLNAGEATLAGQIQSPGGGKYWNPDQLLLSG